jgi:alpha-galactosidase
LHRAHPDWALQLDERPLLTARNQLVLDISRPEVSNYLFEKIETLVREHRIDYLKWDLNRDLTTAGLGAPGVKGLPGYRVQVHAAYALMQRLIDAHPHLEIESCSGGGGRIDFGVLRHSHRVWVSDCIDARSRVADISPGFLQFFPPEIMGSHVGTAPAHTTGRTQNMAFRAAVALPGHFGIEFDLRLLDEAARRELADWIDVYKRWRHRLHGGRVWQGRLTDGLQWQVHGDAPTIGLTSSMTSLPGELGDFLVLVYRVEPSTHRYPPSLPLPMLRSDISYEIVQIEPASRAAQKSNDATAPWIEGQRSEPVVAHGAWLVQVGIPLPRVKAEVATLFHLKPRPDRA